MPVVVWDDTGDAIDVDEAVQKAIDDAPATIFGVPQSSNPSVTELARHAVQVEVEYLRPEFEPPSPPEAPAMSSLVRSANFQAKSRVIYNALEPIGVFDSTGNVTASYPHTKWKIDLRRNGSGQLQAPGRSIDPLPETRTLTYYAPRAVITDNYLATVESLCGKFNDAAYRGHSQGSLQLVRFSAAERSPLDWTLSFGFGYYPPRSNVQVDDNITIPTLRGSWIYWTRDREVYNSTSGVLELQAEIAVVSRVWEEGDFDDLDLPS